MSLRYQGIFDPWFVDGDMPQAVFQYWRYAVEGAFKPGDLLVDYAFVMHAAPCLVGADGNVVISIFSYTGR